MDHEVYDFDKALSIYDWKIKSSEVVIDMSQCLTANYQALALVVLYLWHLRANDCHITIRFREDKKGATQMWQWMGATGWSQVLSSEQQNFRGTEMKPLIALRNKTDFEVALAKLDAYTTGFNVEYEKVEYEKTLRYVLSELMYNTLEHGKKFARVSHLERRIPSIIEFTWYKLRNELQFIVADETFRDRADLGALVEIHPFRAQFRGHEAEESGAGADVGDDGLAGHHDAFQRCVKSGVADAVGEQGAVVFDAHGES